MSSIIRGLITAALLLSLTGCFEVTTVVRVSPDGSGTVTETVLLSRKMIAQMDEMMRGMAASGDGKPAPWELFEPAKLKEQARNMGEGVSYRSGEKVANADFAGYTAIYDFTDITRLRLNQQGDANSAAPAGAGVASTLPVTFRFSKGTPATLFVEQPRVNQTAPPAETPQGDTPPPGAGSDENTRMLAEMFKGLKFKVDIAANGTIVSTNAKHRNGNQVTLFDLDLDKLANAAPLLEKLSSLGGRSLAETRQLLKDVPGLKVDTNDTLTVVFK